MEYCLSAGDGVADHAVLDVNGPTERYFTDDGTGTWAVAADRPARTTTGLRWFGLDGVVVNERELMGCDTVGDLEHVIRAKVPVGR